MAASPVWQTLHRPPADEEPAFPSLHGEAPATEVLLQRLGVFNFKGAPEALEMVQLVQRHLAARRCGCLARNRPALHVIAPSLLHITSSVAIQLAPFVIS